MRPWRPPLRPSAPAPARPSRHRETHGQPAAFRQSVRRIDPGLHLHPSRGPARDHAPQQDASPQRDGLRDARASLRPAAGGRCGAGDGAGGGVPDGARGDRPRPRGPAPDTLGPAARRLLASRTGQVHTLQDPRDQVPGTLGDRPHLPLPAPLPLLLRRCAPSRRPRCGDDDRGGLRGHRPHPRRGTRPRRSASREASPTLREDLPRLVAYAKSRGLRTNLITNGRALLGRDALRGPGGGQAGLGTGEHRGARRRRSTTPSPGRRGRSTRVSAASDTCAPAASTRTPTRRSVQRTGSMFSDCRTSRRSWGTSTSR